MEQLADIRERELAVVVVDLGGGAVIIDGKLVIIKAQPVLGPDPTPWKEVAQEVDQLARVLIPTSMLPDGKTRNILIGHLSTALNEKVAILGKK